MSWTEPPFALFVLAELDSDKINQILKDARSGNQFPVLWLVTDNYDDAPQKEESKTNLGTEPPVSDDWRSPFIGHKIEDAAKWLQGQPDTVDLDRHHFAVLDKQAEEDSSVVVCKIGDRDLKGDSLDFFRESPRHASVFLLGQEFGEWEELAEGRKVPEGVVQIKYGDSE